MEELIRVSGKTVEDALMEASIQLGTSSDNIEYTVIEKETKGFLGIGARKAVIEARKKVTEDEDIISKVFSTKETPAEKKDTGKSPSVKAPKKASSSKEDAETKENRKNTDNAAGTREARKAADNTGNKEESKADTAAAAREERRTADAQSKENRKAAAAGQTGKETSRGTVAASAADKPSAEAPLDEAVKEEGRKEEKQPQRMPAAPEEAKRRAREFLTDIFKAMGTEVSISCEFEEDNLSVNLEGEEMGMLIGKRGQTLDSLQYLTSLVVNKGKASYVRVKIDTENYRERRKATLENLAKNIAFKVKKTRRPVYLEPMNPYERRIIHSALQNDPYVTTHSEGEEPCRKVVVTLKKHEKASSWDDE